MKRDAFPNGARRIKQVIYFVMLVDCTRQAATHELLRALGVGWVQVSRESNGGNARASICRLSFAKRESLQPTW